MQTGWEFYSRKSFLFILTFEKLGGKEITLPRNVLLKDVRIFVLVFLSLLGHKSRVVSALFNSP